MAAAGMDSFSTKLEFVTCKSVASPGEEHQVAVRRFVPTSKDESQLPVLCVHGLLRNGRDFYPIASALAAAGREVAVLDVVGRGCSDRLPPARCSEYGYPQYIPDALTVLDHLAWPRLHWVGTSMGGLIGMMVAATPQAVRAHAELAGLCLVDVAPAVPAAAIHAIASYTAGNASREPFPDAAAAEAYVRTTYAGFGNLSDAEWRQMAINSTRPADGTPPHVAGTPRSAEQAVDENPGTVAAAVDGPRALDYDLVGIAEDFKRIAEKQPEDVEDIDLWAAFAMVQARGLLVVRGEQSPFVPPSMAARMTGDSKPAGVTGAAEVFSVADAGHAPALIAQEQQDAIARFFTTNESD